MLDYFLKFRTETKKIDVGSTMQTFTERNRVFLLVGDWVKFSPIMK